MNVNSKTSRRNFLRQLTLITATTALSGLSLEQLQAAKAKPRKIAVNEKVNLACIGIGFRGAEIMKELYKTGHCNIVALCGNT